VFEGPPGSPGETNNVTASAAPVQIVSNPPDLVIVPGSFEPWAMAQAGSFLRASWGVLNQGTGTTVGGTWRDKVYVSLDNVKGGPDDRLLGTFVRNGNLAAGDSYYALDRQVNIPIDLSGTVYLYVRTDADNQVYEGANEHNNDSELVPVTIVQNLADLQVTALQPLPARSRQATG
jgi:subtilase family serine protease